ncbi:MAG: hypothetical protein QT08_C0018G0020 [archaeon GW2011_AR17]|nr:MAG: hypothetical protein QT08_C0018G0020 [archaeon GW2011_AR17]MBS3154451.1 hypothetical protein [Candidatus Woesearchaeota archaeon]HIH15697.1 DUF4242 domain-containing protein [Nanoarchaeota archaeon]HIH59352.1 DUF4242 domain-containing protein [Nanoarchaeota archaeon]HII13570.1 DUF4242 domain-containing protein [Nanoarchaeota archaeon]
MTLSRFRRLIENTQAIENYFKEINLEKREEEEYKEWTGTQTERIEFGDVEFEIIRAYYTDEHGLLYCLYIEPSKEAGHYELRALCPDFLRTEDLTGIEDLFIYEGEEQTTIRALFTRYKEIKRKAIEEQKPFTDYLIFSSPYVQ